MEKVTIDQLGIEAHRRYAFDQETLDTAYITESPLVPQHSEITGTSAIYSSKWEELFEVHLKNIPWAAFSPPPKYFRQRNRFFSHALIPGILWSDEDENEEDEERDNERKKQNESMRNIINAISCRRIKGEESALLNLIESVKLLNSLLREINSRKLQYQKG
ncbi:MAG TPA: DUF5399 family protein [Rhabdochlamydiaceae bacterium]|nr:DUF5399 family protein [Rhabdochlamydiaceae bacterium]